MSTSRRSFLKTLAAAVISGPVVVKAALTKREPRNYRTVFNPKWKEIDLRPKTEVISDGRGGTITFTNMPRMKSEPLKNYTQQFAKNWERMNPGKVIVHREWYDAKK